MHDGRDPTPPASARHRRRRAAALAFLAATGAAAVTQRASGGVPLVDTDGRDFKWDLDAPTAGTNVPETDVVTYYVGPGPAELLTYVDPVRQAVRSWEIPTARIRFREDPARPATGHNGTDRVNWIGWVTSGLSPFTFAATYPTRDGSRVLDMDVLLNDRDFFWSRSTPGSPGAADVQSLVTHEWGHAIGLDHVPLRKSTMYFSAITGQTSLRSIEPDDVAIVGTAYPNAAFAATTGTLAGTLAIGGTKDDRAAHVVAVSVATGEPAASSLTRPDGTWTITGLPAGAYRVLVAPCIPLGNAMNQYWRTGSTTFLPAVAADVAANPAQARTFVVAPGAVVPVPDIATGPGTRAFEPNDDVATATPIRLGDAVAARLETNSDQDWYELDLVVGDRIAVNVMSWAVGSDVDPAVRLESPDGATKTVYDMSQDGTSLAGEDRDARFEWQVTTTGKHRVRVALDKPTSGNNTFYVLFVTRASGAPSAALTEVTADPPVIDAGSTQTSEVVVRPRREDGSDVGPGATVRIVSSRGAAIAPDPLEDRGDGTYRAFVVAPSARGRDILTATVDADVFVGPGTARVTTAIPSAAEIVYVGAMSSARSALEASPRRTRVSSESAPVAHELRFFPRDDDGESAGPGREDDIAVTVSPARGTSVASIDYVGAGEYRIVLAGGDSPGDSTVTATYRDEASVSRDISWGFDLTAVLEAAARDVAAFRATDGLTKRVTASLASADAKIASARALAAQSGASKDLAAMKATRAATLAVNDALRRTTRLTDPGTVTELALALRARAAAAVDGARPLLGSDADQRRLDAAEALLRDGDTEAAAGNGVRASALWIAARRKILPVF